MARLGNAFSAVLFIAKDLHYHCVGARSKIAASACNSARGNRGTRGVMWRPTCFTCHRQCLRPSGADRLRPVATHCRYGMGITTDEAAERATLHLPLILSSSLESVFRSKGVRRARVGPGIRLSPNHNIGGNGVEGSMPIVSCQRCV